MLHAVEGACETQFGVEMLIHLSTVNGELMNHFTVAWVENEPPRHYRKISSNERSAAVRGIFQIVGPMSC